MFHISRHAATRAIERGLTGKAYTNAMRQLAANRYADGEYILPTGHHLVVKGETLVTVKPPGSPSRTDSRLNTYRL